jgi:predicted DNA-binding transcriptional regulator AlpA
VIEQTKSSRIVPFAETPSKDRILRVGAVLRRFDPPVARQTLYRWAKMGIFPPPFSLNGRPAWLESAVDQFIATRITKPRDPENGPSSSAA